MIATLWIGALAAALCCVLQDPAPEVEAAKARLRTAMSATAIAFEQSESGLSLLARFDHDGDRKQTVCVALAPNQTNGLVCHNIYTTVWIGAAAAPDEALMRRVFAQAKKLGAFYMLNEGARGPSALVCSSTRRTCPRRSRPIIRGSRSCATSCASSMPSARRRMRG